MDDATSLSRIRNIETRRVQLTGGATLIVSLPKEWARQANLKPGDEVVIIQQLDGSLLIVPKKLLKSPVLEARLDITQDIAKDSSKIERLLIAYYLSGAELVRITVPEDMSNVRRSLKRFIRDRLTGFEIIEESRNQLVIQDLVDPSNTDIRTLVLNMIRVVVNMMNDLRAGIEKEDPAILSDVIERDAEVDRFYLFIRRILKKMLITSKVSADIIFDPRTAIEYSLISKSVERIADNISEIAAELKSRIQGDSLKLPLDLKGVLVEIIQEEQRLLEIISGYLLLPLPDPRYVNKLVEFTCSSVTSRIELMINRLYTTDNNIDPKFIPTLRIVLYNLLRVSEYIIDVAESLLDLAITRLVRGLGSTS